MKVTTKFDRREEGLRALASMIVDAYRKGKTFPKNNEEPLISEDEIVIGWESDGNNGFSYTETVSVQAFKRRKRNNKKLKPRQS